MLLPLSEHYNMAGASGFDMHEAASLSQLQCRDVCKLLAHFYLEDVFIKTGCFADESASW